MRRRPAADRLVTVTVVGGPRLGRLFARLAALALAGAAGVLGAVGERVARPTPRRRVDWGQFDGVVFGLSAAAAAAAGGARGPPSIRGTGGSPRRIFASPEETEHSRRRALQN